MSDGWQPAIDNLQTQINAINAEINALSGQEGAQVAQIAALVSEVASLQTEVSVIQQQVASRKPIVVASQSFLNQSSVLPVAPIFTPTETGLYRVSIYMEFSAGQFNAQAAPRVTWTDDYGQKFRDLVDGQGIVSSSNGFITVSTVVYDLAQSAVSVGVLIFNSGNPGQTYNLFVEIEQL